MFLDPKAFAKASAIMSIFYISIYLPFSPHLRLAFKSLDFCCVICFLKGFVFLLTVSVVFTIVYSCTIGFVGGYFFAKLYNRYAKKNIENSQE